MTRILEIRHGSAGAGLRGLAQLGAMNPTMDATADRAVEGATQGPLRFVSGGPSIVRPGTTSTTRSRHED